MKKKLLVFGVIMGLMVLAACGKDKDVDDGSNTQVLPLNVDLTVTEQAEIGDTVKMEALVTYGDDKVEDADKVVYEVWEEGKKDASIMIDAVNEKNGVYSAETTFDHDGLYTIQVHVDAKQLHSMPLKKVTIGQGSATVGVHGEAHHGENHHGEDHSEDHGDNHSESHGEHEHGHTNGFALHFVKPENATTSEATELVTHLQIDGQPLENVNVRYEISSDVYGDKHEWLDANESVAGEYMATNTFEKGSYTVKIHVKNDDGLHEHEEYSFDVK